MIDPPRWSAAQLNDDLQEAVNLFRRDRLSEPGEVYASAFDKYHQRIEELFDLTGNLIDLDEHAREVVTSDDLLEAFRYLGGPPLSEDDLKTLAGVNSLRPSQLTRCAADLEHVLRVILAALDRRRFPWVAQRRKPTQTERKAAMVASAVLLAASYTATNRRSVGQKAQESELKAALIDASLTEVKAHRILRLDQAPQRGEFCRESILGSAKADFVIRLWDHRTMPLECKVSNSATNSVKRLNREAVGKAEGWINDFGRVQVIPAAVLRGVYKLHDLQDAQNGGLTLFWSHNLRALVQWIERTRNA